MARSPRRLLRRRRRGCGLLLGVRSRLLAAVLQGTGQLRALLECVGGFREALQTRELHAHHIIIGSVRVRGVGGGFFQLGDGLLVVLAAEINKSEAAVRLRFTLRLHLGELLVGHVRGLRQSGQDFERVFFILLTFLQLAFRREILGIVVVRDYPADQDQDGDVIRIRGQRLIGVGVHLRKILFGIFRGGQALIDLIEVFAAGIFLNVLLAQLNALVCVLRLCIAERFVSGLFFRISFRRDERGCGLPVLRRLRLSARGSRRRGLLILRERIRRRKKTGEKDRESCDATAN